MTNDAAHNKRLIEQKPNSLHWFRKRIQVHRDQNLEAWAEQGEKQGPGMNTDVIVLIQQALIGLSWGPLPVSIMPELSSFVSVPVSQVTSVCFSRCTLLLSLLSHQLCITPISS